MAKDAGLAYVWTDKKRTIFGLPLSFTRYYLTTSKLICRTGLFNIVEDEIDLYKITDKKMQLSFWQRMFGCGTIIVHSRDTDSPQKEIKGIKKPREFSELLDKHITDHRDRYGIRGRDMYTSGHHHEDCDVCD